VSPNPIIVGTRGQTRLVKRSCRAFEDGDGIAKGSISRTLEGVTGGAGDGAPGDRKGPTAIGGRVVDGGGNGGGTYNTDHGPGHPVAAAAFVVRLYPVKIGAGLGNGVAKRGCGPAIDRNGIAKGCRR